jgi:hypothetical protein
MESIPIGNRLTAEPVGWEGTVIQSSHRKIAYSSTLPYDHQQCPIDGTYLCKGPEGDIIVAITSSC